VWNDGLGTKRGPIRHRSGIAANGTKRIGPKAIED
jgi:hypothetical protein